MRHLRLILALGLLGAASPAPPQEEPLLLLDDEPEADTATSGGADNSRCHVCHLNFASEPIAVTHARAEIGCGDCHGDCDKHIDDESWASGGPGTPPGIMFPPEKVDPACRECHPKHDAAADVLLERRRERGLEKTSPKDVVCTDCHGHHRIKTEIRNAWWDKRTGEPIKPAAKAADPR